MTKNELVIIDINHFSEAALPFSDRTFYQYVKYWSILRSNSINNK